MEKENPNLITVFICFLRSGLRFTRYDTNNVGLAFIEEIKKHNANFKPVKVQQRERDQEYTVNAFPKEFEPLINSLIEEYRIKNKLEYRLKKPKTGGSRGGGFNRGGSGRTGGQYRDNRSSGGSYRPSGSNQGSYNPRREGGEGRTGGYQRPTGPGGQSGSSYRPRRTNDDQPRTTGGYRDRNDQQPGQGSFQRRNRDGQLGSNSDRQWRDNDVNRRSPGEGYRSGEGGRREEDRFIPNRLSVKKEDKNAEEKPKRPRRDPSKD